MTRRDAREILRDSKKTSCIDFAQHPDFDITMTWLDNQTREITLCDILNDADILDYDSPEDYLMDMYGVHFEDLDGFIDADGLTSYIVFLSHE